MTSMFRPEHTDSGSLVIGLPSRVLLEAGAPGGLDVSHTTKPLVALCAGLVGNPSFEENVNRVRGVARHI